MGEYRHVDNVEVPTPISDQPPITTVSPLAASTHVTGSPAAGDREPSLLSRAGRKASLGTQAHVVDSTRRGHLQAIAVGTAPAFHPAASIGPASIVAK